MSSDSYYTFKPGLHSHNSKVGAPPVKRRISWLQTLLLLIGLSCLGYYGYTFADEKIYQAYGNWAFDQQISGRAVTFQDYIREQTPFAFLAGSSSAVKAPVIDTSGLVLEGAVIGRVAVNRLKLSAVVRQGVGNDTLSQAVGHVPSTAMAGQQGNFAIAAHRDTLFRSLKDIRKGDIVSFQSSAQLFEYQVVATKIVKPTDVSVLRPDGGGLIESPKPSGKILTMITCYPFYYVGAAPKRFIVQAELVR